MKQVIQSYKTGALELAEVPAPAPGADAILVRTVRSVVSVGTERSMLDLAKKSLIGKAVARPDLVRQVVGKIKSEGLAETYRQAMGRLDNPVPLGYSSSGIVIEAGSRVDRFAVGDRVACSGSGYASHAEISRLPQTMAWPIPDGVGFDEAAFVTLGGIALHGVRVAEVTLGERVVVLGLGLLGQIAVQILKASGCRVLGADIDPAKLRLAEELGADATSLAEPSELADAVLRFSGGVGADAVLVFAATASNEPIEQAAQIARDRGRIVVPGLVGLDLPRKIFYEKELSFRVSRAWGPGLYDPQYEERGLDYPGSYVRWTAQRNLAAFLDLLASKSVRIAPLITHRFPFQEAVSVYERLLEAKERFMGVVLEYPENPDRSRVVHLDDGSRSVATKPTASRSHAPGAAPPIAVARIGLLGAGQFARGTLLPALAALSGFELRAIATSSGVSARHVARRYKMSRCATDAADLLGDPEIDLVMILTRHGQHAQLACDALLAGKDVFVEKPLALDAEQLAQVVSAHEVSGRRLMVGFNRRFAPLTQQALRLLGDVSGPLTITIRVNTGPLPASSWVLDPRDGGGPIVGEACHFIDLAQALTRSLTVKVHAEALHAGAGVPGRVTDAVITLQMANGSLVTILYTTIGDKAASRERIEAYGAGAALVIDNFKTLTWSRAGRRKQIGRSWSSVDRGHRAELAALLDAIHRGAPPPVPFADYIATTQATFAALESLRIKQPVEIATRTES